MKKKLPPNKGHAGKSMDFMPQQPAGKPMPNKHVKPKMKKAKVHKIKGLDHSRG